jgi:large subunit ribosomal protein L9
MKVLLIKDVYKLGHAGDIKRVADGYGRNYLLPQGLAVLASAGALKQVHKIKSTADIRRTELNSELKDLAAQIEGLVLSFAAKAGDTGKLYGSITTEDVAKAISEKTRYEVKRQQMDMQPVRNLGEYNAHVRLTMDLVPVVKVIVYREGEANPVQEAPKAPAAETPATAETPVPEPEAPAAEAAAPETPVETPAAEAPAEEAAPAEPEA